MELFQVPFKSKETTFQKGFGKKGLERNGKNKNVLEFDVEKDGGMFLDLFVCLSIPASKILYFCSSKPFMKISNFELASSNLV